LTVLGILCSVLLDDPLQTGDARGFFKDVALDGCAVPIAWLSLRLNRRLSHKNVTRFS
jgi:hypothetical protein